MPHLLLINPNTRQALTAQLLAQVQACWGEPGDAAAVSSGAMPALMGITAPFGADYIASEQSYTVAAHAVLDAWYQHVQAQGRPRAVLVACFGDPGVWALRECADVPVMGLAEAAMREADEAGPFAIVTGGHAWGPMLERLARGLRLAGSGHLREVHTVEASGGELLADPLAGAALLREACLKVLAQDAEHSAAGQARESHLASMRDAQALQSLILGGAALGGWAARLQPDVALPLIDSVAAGARWLRQWA